MIKMVLCLTDDACIILQYISSALKLLENMHGMLLLWGLNVVLNTVGKSLWPQYSCCLLISTSLPPDTAVNTMTSDHSVTLFVMSPWVTSFLHMCYVQQGSFVSSC